MKPFLQFCNSFHTSSLGFPEFLSESSLLFSQIMLSTLCCTMKVASLPTVQVSTRDASSSASSNLNVLFAPLLLLLLRHRRHVVPLTFVVLGFREPDGSAEQRRVPRSAGSGSPLQGRLQVVVDGRGMFIGEGDDEDADVAAGEGEVELAKGLGI